ncbi:MAG: pyridoxamine 5'-phosphate oxidase family protein [Acidimicrobiia bacterium]|nr:pyridoxamine 5'-phosphate oxidase family protein [Acidimicrobiia bacterium]
MATDPDRIQLRDIEGCFDGVIPPAIATSSAAGEPNVTHLSQLYVVDDGHVGVSNQFFGKTTTNLAENPHAAVLVTDSGTYDTYHLDLHYERTDTEGPLFEELKASIESISSLMQMEDVFALRGVDVYRVLAVRRIAVGAPPS